MNLTEYFARIGYKPQVMPNLADLHALTHAHVQSIPFENLDVLQGRAISLDPDKIFDKMVRQHRGGYCFEHNGLFIHVLNELGYQASSLGARVRLHLKDRSKIPVRTHLLILVKLGGKKWLTDVGFGSLSLTSALLWQDGLEQQTPRDRRRLVREDGRWFHQAWQADHWQDLYEFDGQPMHASDQKVANWYASTHPDSNFTSQLIISRIDPDGNRLSIQGNELRVRNATGELKVMPINEADIPTIACKRFNMRWP